MELRKQPSRLVLEDGSSFPGYLFGPKKIVAGEVVFNTGMTGYPQSLTDPSYHGQILVMTYPLIGNYGVPGYEKEKGLLKYFESDRIYVRGLVVADYSDDYYHWNAKKSLSEWLQEYGVPGITGVDTRRLTKKLREKGTMLGKIVYDKKDIRLEDPNKKNLVAEVSIKEPVVYGGGKKRVVLIDGGVKSSIIRALLERGLTVIRVPWDHRVSREKVHGIVISNGPGDPIQCKETIDNVREMLSRNIPILGICLGAQILALAAGARTYKLKYGHRSHNQPCVESGTKRCYITPQNHGYAVDTETLPEDWREWFYNNNDWTNEGVIHVSKPFLGAQFHPEASPGPDDTAFIFDLFLRSLG
jgi:carbamoyl-phosphate synthase small subunit